MRVRHIALAALALGASPALAADEPVTVYVPQTAIAAAAETKDGVGGLFVLSVQSAAKVGKILYLNSEEDYRDPANLSIAVDMDIYDDLRRSVGGDPEILLEGKRIRVAGVAKAIPIGRKSDRKKVLYHQTRVYVYDPRQVELLD